MAAETLLSSVDWSAVLRATAPLIRQALEEDLGHPATLAGDITSSAIFGNDDRVARATLVCRSTTVVCGTPVAHAIVQALNPQAAQDVIRQAHAQGICFEVSGGVTPARLGTLATLGVDRVSMGALTHTVTPPDLSLELC